MVPQFRGIQQLVQPKDSHLFADQRLDDNISKISSGRGETQKEHSRKDCTTAPAAFQHLSPRLRRSPTSPSRCSEADKKEFQCPDEIQVPTNEQKLNSMITSSIDVSHETHVNDDRHECCSCSGSSVVDVQSEQLDAIVVHHHVRKRKRKQRKRMIKFGRLPKGGEDHIIYTRQREMSTISFITAGWVTIITACFGFKWLAIKEHIRAPDKLAEYIKNSPTASNQWFTFIGVLLGEVCLILWGHAISYMAFRRLAYAKERTELMTYGAWSEMCRAGYTLSRRKPMWPVFTIIVFIGNTFLPAGFSTLLTPQKIVYTTTYKGVELDQLSAGFASAISFLPASTFPNPANLSCGSQYVSNFWTFASHPNVIFDPCPALDDVQTLVMAGRAKLEASVNFSEPILSIPGSLTYLGGTGGTGSLGPMGVLPWGMWRYPPRHSPTPDGYNYTYELNQQGLTVDVHCWQPTAPEELAVLQAKETGIPHLLRLRLQCSPWDDEQDADVSYHYIGSSSNIVKGCAGKDAKRQDDADATIMYFKDAGASVYGTQGSELGGDLICELRPKWTRNIVKYDSHRDIVTVNTLNDENGLANRLTGFHGELGPGKKPFSPTSEESKQDFFQYYSRLLVVQGPLAAVTNAFVFTGSLSAVINGTHGSHQAAKLSSPNGSNGSRVLTLDRKATDVLTLKDLNNTVLFGKNMAIQSLAAFNARVNSNKVRSWIQPSQVETFIKGVFEYAATSQREWFQHYAVDGGDFVGPISLANGTAQVIGAWRQETLGWGTNENNSNSFVCISLLPVLCFAVISLGMLAWSHIFDAPRDGIPYAPDIDPTDWLEAVVASSQGGLRHAFPPEALGTKHGLHAARKVRVRLGQITEEDGKSVRIGFVCVD